ncbi:MAG: hydantoinase/oxoprolinase family protein, partial [Acetobacteraceae bacterium]|nr:hydantoinase/oxoprolinase family protein [Acetobacteraceae bacterium]
AGAWFGRGAGLDRVLAFDMGGTTAKLALVDDGEPLVGWGFEAARQKRFLRGSGLPIQIATIELVEIGAGGGSIARRSELGTLQVGPESAGAAPGPACYGRGGTAPTVTDSDLLLGYLDAGFFLGGAMRVDEAAASASLERLAASLAVTPARAAAGAHELVNEAMAGAARVAIAERGGALGDYTLLATGGAGPVHAWQVARKLGLRRLVCPPGAGAGSALGMLMAPARVDRVASVNAPLDRVDWAALAESLEQLRRDGLGVIRQSDPDLAGLTVRRMADMRYVGQGFEITVALPETLTPATLREAFEARYRALFTRTARDAAIEVVALRLCITAPMPGARRAITVRHPEQGRPARDALKGHRHMRLPDQDGSVPAPVYDRYALRPGTRLPGPAIVEENESTLIIGPGGIAEVLRDGSIAVELP